MYPALFLCVYRKSCLSLNWLVCWSVSLLRKCQNRAQLPILASIFILVTFPLSFTFIHFHSPSFTFIHFQAIIKNVHSSKTFIYTFLISRVHISAFFSQLKRVTLIHQMKLKFQCHTFKRLMEKDKEKGRLYTNTCV